MSILDEIRDNLEKKLRGSKNKTEKFKNATESVTDEIMAPLKNAVNKGEYTPFHSVISPDTRQTYAELFRKNFDFAVNKLKNGEIRSLNLEFIESTCWVGPGDDLIDNSATMVNPLLAGTKVAKSSAKSDYAEKLANAIKDSKITSVELSTDFATNGVAIWKTTQKERDTIMSALPTTVKRFSNGLGFTNKDLQDLTDLMNRVPGIEVHLNLIQPYAYSKVEIGPFDDKTFADFVSAVKKSDGVYINCLSDCPLFDSSEKRKLMLEQSIGAKAVETNTGLVFDKNYAFKQKRQESVMNR